MGYSEAEDSVRVDFFKDTGKWYETLGIKWTGGYRNCDIREALLKSVRDHFGGNRRLSGMTIVCLEPYHEHSHPIMIRNWDKRLEQD